MPNHVTNEIHASEEVIKSLKNEEGRVDFNMIIPRPKSIDEIGSVYLRLVYIAKVKSGICDHIQKDASHIKKRLSEYNNLNEEDKKITDLMINNYKKYGYGYWYDFSIGEWDTKWNAYGQCDKNNPCLVRFQTAWSIPFKVFQELSLRFPDEEILIKYADEDFGSNCGEITFKNGITIDTDVAPLWSTLSEEGQRKWTKFAVDLIRDGESLEQYGLDENYEYIEE